MSSLHDLIEQGMDLSADSGLRQDHRGHAGDNYPDYRVISPDSALLMAKLWPTPAWVRPAATGPLQASQPGQQHAALASPDDNTSTTSRRRRRAQPAAHPAPPVQLPAAAEPIDPNDFSSLLSEIFGPGELQRAAQRTARKRRAQRPGTRTTAAAASVDRFACDLHLALPTLAD